MPRSPRRCARTRASSGPRAIGAVDCYLSEGRRRSSSFRRPDFARARVGRQSGGIGRASRAPADQRLNSIFCDWRLVMVVRVDGATHSLWFVDFWATRECPPGAVALRPKTRAAVRLRALAAGWLSSKAWTIRYERAKASESPRVAKSACKMWFRLQSASNSPKTHVFGTMRSVSRRPITVAVFRRAVRHHRTPARRSTPSPTPRRCPAVAESASAENRRMATAA